MLQLVNRTDKATSPRPTRDKSHSLNGPRRKKPASEMTFLALATQGAKPEIRIEPGWPSSIPTVERYANNQKPETEIFPAQRFEIVRSRRNGDRHLPSLLTPPAWPRPSRTSFPLKLGILSRCFDASGLSPGYGAGPL